MIAKKKRAAGAKKSVRSPTKRQGRPQTNPKSLANLKPPWKAGEPSPNPAGRPKLLGESYKAWLGQVNAEGITNAEAVASAMGQQAIKGDVGAAREIRAATEGDKVRLETWQSELAEHLKAGHLKPEDVVAELGIDGARDILIAAGAALPQSVPVETAAGDHSAGAES